MLTQSPNREDLEAVIALSIEVAAAAIAAVVVFGYVTWLLAKAARLAPAAMVTLALSIITILALAAYAATQAEVIAAVVGTGIGALAGAVTAQLGNKNEPPFTPVNDDKQQGDTTPPARDNEPDEGETNG